MEASKCKDLSRLELMAAVCILLLGLVTGRAFGAEIVESGTCGENGDNVQWELDDEGTMTLIGSGKMLDMSTNYIWFQFNFNLKTDVKKLVVKSGITNIGAQSFNGFKSLQEVELPDTLLSIDNNAFPNCNLTSIIIPDSVLSIGDYAFGWNQKLSSVRMGKNVTRIGMGAFQACSLSEGITLPRGLTKIERETFSGTKLPSITIPWGVTSIEYRAFNQCYQLSSVKLPDTLKSIGLGAFAACRSLVSLNVPDSVTDIKNEAFSNCTSLKRLRLSKNVIKLDYVSFAKTA